MRSSRTRFSPRTNRRVSCNRINANKYHGPPVAKTRRRSISSTDTTLNRQHDLPPRMSFSKVGQSFRRLAQAIASFNHRHHFAALQKILHKVQILPSQLRQKKSHLLAPPPRQHRPQRKRLENLYQATTRRHINSILGQQTPVFKDRMTTIRSQNQIVSLPTPR